MLFVHLFLQNIYKDIQSNVAKTFDLDKNDQRLCSEFQKHPNWNES